MAYNNLIDNFLGSRLPQTYAWSNAGDPVVNMMNSQINQAANREEQRRDIEWANRQRMYDPAYWASAFGMSGSSGGGGAGKPVYQDTAEAYRTRMNSLMDNPDSIANTGAYKFAFNQGQEALNRQLAAKGLLNSGNRLYELTKFGQGLASQQYGAEMDRLASLVNSTRAGDISRYGADANLYGVELQGQNQLRAMMMKNMLDRLDRQEAGTPQYAFGRSGYASMATPSTGTWDNTSNLANPGGMWTMESNSYDPYTRKATYTNSLTGERQLRYGA